MDTGCPTSCAGSLVLPLAERSLTAWRSQQTTALPGHLSFGCGGFSDASLSLRSGSNVCRPPALFGAHRGEARGQSWPRALPQILRGAEWHQDLNQHQWAQRLTCIFEPDTLPTSAVPLGTRGYADDLAGTSIADSYKILNDINQLTTSSLAAALGRRALQLHPKQGGHVIEAPGQAFSS